MGGFCDERRGVVEIGGGNGKAWLRMVEKKMMQ